MPIWDKRMMILADHLISSGLIRSRRAFFESIGFRPENYAQIKDGKRSFTVTQLVTASMLYDVDMNWLAGITDTMLRVREQTTVLDRLKSVVSEVEAALKNR